MIGKLWSEAYLERAARAEAHGAGGDSVDVQVLRSDGSVSYVVDLQSRGFRPTITDDARGLMSFEVSTVFQLRLAAVAFQRAYDAAIAAGLDVPTEPTFDPLLVHEA